MKRSLAAFERHLAAPSPAFLCSGCYQPARRFVAEVEHRVAVPATPGDLERLREILGPGSEQVADFYSRHDGITLYCDRRSENAGIRFFPIAEWLTVTAAVQEDFRESQLYDLYGPLLDGIVVAEICHSGNYFIYQTSWRRRGRIYYLMHDPMYSKPPRFRSLGSLLSDILADPAAFLTAMGGYTYFSDGETEEQWHPERFLRRKPAG